MIKRSAHLLFYLFLVGFVLWLPRTSISADKQQTVPTRTPTPPAATATPISGGGTEEPPPQPSPTNVPPGNDTPVPEPDTPEPTIPATDVPAVTLVATPEGGFWPTAAPCSPNPTILALGRVNVRIGPGAEYALLNQLSYLEVRPITGRAQFAPWWQIELVDDSRGWVSDQIVVVSGYTGQVPVIAVPVLADGSTPEPGPRWDPTPNPICTPLPTTAATHTPFPTITAPAPTKSGGGTGAIPLVNDPATIAAATVTAAGPESSGTVADPPPAIPIVPTAVDEQVLIAGGSPPTGANIPAGEPNESAAEPAGGVPIGWLPFAALGLLIAGIAVWIYQRK